MIDPWRHVVADDEIAADLLAGTVEIVLESGGWIAPGTRFVVDDGDLRVTSTAADGAPLMVLPAACCIPVTRVAWTASTTELAFDGLLGDLTDVETELLVLQTALLNRLERVPWLMRTHPLLASMPDAAVAAVRTVAPEFRMTHWKPADVLWSNRVMRIPRDGAEPEPFALPLIDMLNHRAGGPVGTWDGATFAIDAGHAGDECVMDYGHDRDAITMAITYGFSDTGCRIARSAVSDVVHGRDPRPAADLVAADLALLDGILIALGDAPGPAMDILRSAVVHQRQVIAG